MRTTQIVIFILLSISISSCKKQIERNTNFIPELKIEASSILTKNLEIVEFIDISISDINEY